MQAIPGWTGTLHMGDFLKQWLWRRPYRQFAHGWCPLQASNKTAEDVSHAKTIHLSCAGWLRTKAGLKTNVQSALGFDSEASHLPRQVCFAYFTGGQFAYRWDSDLIKHLLQSHVACFRHDVTCDCQ